MSVSLRENTFVISFNEGGTYGYVENYGLRLRNATFKIKESVNMLKAREEHKSLEDSYSLRSPSTPSGKSLVSYQESLMCSPDLWNCHVHPGITELCDSSTAQPQALVATPAPFEFERPNKGLGLLNHALSDRRLIDLNNQSDFSASWVSPQKVTFLEKSHLKEKIGDESSDLDSSDIRRLTFVLSHRMHDEGESEFEETHENSRLRRLLNSRRRRLFPKPPPKCAIDGKTLVGPKGNTPGFPIRKKEGTFVAELSKLNSQDRRRTFVITSNKARMREGSCKLMRIETVVDDERLFLRDATRDAETLVMNRRLLQVVAEPQVALQPMSFQTNFLASKESFNFAKFAKSLSFKNKQVFVPGLPEKPKPFAWRKMGNSNLRKIPSRGDLPVPPPHEDPYVKRSIQRRKNGQREVHKNTWRAEKRGLAGDTGSLSSSGPDRPKLPKRATYKKAKNNQPMERTTQMTPRNREDRSSLSNGDSAGSTLPSRSDILPPDGDSMRSVASPLETPIKCSSCAEYKIRLSKAYTQKGAIVVTLEKTQRELSLSQKRAKELEKLLEESRKVHDDDKSTIKDYESEMCQLQKDKALFLHELNVTRRQLTRAMEQSDTSDCSHVSSIYVSGSQKTLDDGLGEDVSPDDEDYEEEKARQWKEMKERYDYAQEELERLKNVEQRNEELESLVRNYEERVNQLEEHLREARRYEGKDASTQTFRRDGTFTRQPDKTKIPKRLLGHHSSLPVISDPPSLYGLHSTTSSLSRLETLQKSLRVKENEIASLKSEMSELEKELERQRQQEDMMQDTEMAQLKSENERLHKELRIVTENYKKEMVMRKKYFNMAEDLKGKIRVFCRVKPPDDVQKNTVLEIPDEYTIQLRTQRAKYEFTFDGVFSAEHSQADVFANVQNLVQSALDGYNVCIFAYGQTGSGKTYTLSGNELNPGIAPCAFQRIFELIQENSSEMNFRICASVLELYNDRLIDLLKDTNEDKLKIRRDQYGLVYVQGSESREVHDETQLLELFQEACKSRHIGSTRMNPDSSRSHLIVTILIESTNRITGTVLRGKLSIVDLAGSERTGKTAVVANQLKEANSINKSLSALGDVIAALSTEQPHVPYRNNKLTTLMQDSLGSNAKTLMFVTISSSEHNVEESLNSLTYASRVKQITNSATRMSESKEIARLRSIIMKLTKEDRNAKFLLN